MNERSILNELDTDNIQPKIKFAKSSADVASEQVLDESAGSEHSTHRD